MQKWEDEGVDPGRIDFLSVAFFPPDHLWYVISFIRPALLATHAPHSLLCYKIFYVSCSVQAGNN